MVLMNIAVVLIFVLNSIECVEKPFGFVAANGKEKTFEKN